MARRGPRRPCLPGAQAAAGRHAPAPEITIVILTASADHPAIAAAAATASAVQFTDAPPTQIHALLDRIRQG